MVETFSGSEINKAIEPFLEYGQRSRVQRRPRESSPGHQGYFSDNGWAARCLRFHLKQRTANEDAKTRKGGAR